MNWRALFGVPPLRPDLEDLERRFNTVGAFWHDAYAQWQVVADWQRRTFDDCRLVGWGSTLDDAIGDLARHEMALPESPSGVFGGKG